jgi:hypothetical protein
MMFKPEVVFGAANTLVPKSTAPLSPALLLGFIPAFRHQDSGEIRLCQGADGRIARQHLLDALPAAWVVERDREGRAVALAAAVEPGYLRGDTFWRLYDLTHPTLDG